VQRSAGSAVMVNSRRLLSDWTEFLLENFLGEHPHRIRGENTKITLRQMSGSLSERWM
jgi:hypothetical protein